jgi:hypothetical protein
MNRLMEPLQCALQFAELLVRLQREKNPTRRLRLLAQIDQMHAKTGAALRRALRQYQRETEKGER